MPHSALELLWPAPADLALGVSVNLRPKAWCVPYIPQAGLGFIVVAGWTFRFNKGVLNKGVLNNFF